VTSKATAVTDIQDLDEEPVVTGARAQVASGNKDKGLEPVSDGTLDEYKSVDLLWGQFDNMYGLSARVCTIVPLGHDMTGCIAKVQNVTAYYFLHLSTRLQHRRTQATSTKSPGTKES
jgi:hypothetical protein